MPNAVIALLFGAGAAGWIYAKMMRQTGGNTRNSLIVAGMGGFFAFLVVLTVLGMIG